ncbi:TetR/AcrR family transcriptional regulator [Conexibacter woesei]|uniref:Regulatory protein TetR n=1 Tax=Conexibacter woesei (strain DSM 14684 / CCUG 47730 / CIP 108061 / JCM 11494 / NBRC 100937 / ID131577) TaxID=469383 RepID=D3F8B1_CONWI|nr:TetR/AcrR family transcriptional regulator [Conexibacter woesei]ADB48981.1 regulatory protein TetR [Conexibacter woesei DSM 14684]
MATVPSRHEQLLGQLVELFLSEGIRDLTLADLAARLHCSKSTLYALGPSKEQLVVVAVRSFFRTATVHVEERTAAEPDPAARIPAYLRAVADALRPASEQFMSDLLAHPAARDVYRRNTEIAAERVRQLIADGVAAGTFRDVHATFVADTIAATMERIQRGEVRANTGVGDAEAYDELAALVVEGIRS